MPRSPRAARRAAKPGPPHDTASLRAAIAAARLPGSPPQVTEQARALLLGWLDPSRTFADALRDLSSGEAARAIGLALLDRTPEPPGLDCKSGCAFCCILPGDDGGTVTAAEARTLHAALIPLQGTPDGTQWHPQACPALDPATRLCRAYAARPMICRTYVSRDVTACEAIAEGHAKPGTGTLPAQIITITVHALARAALHGTTPVHTYNLRAIATAALRGTPAPDALKSARHSPKSLDAERRRLARGLTRGAG